MFAVVVTLQVREAHLDVFREKMRANAASSLEQEAGCLRFDVCEDAGRAGEVFLYELYTNADAFAAHLKSEHFIAFDAQTADMIASKDVRTFQSVWP